MSSTEPDNESALPETSAPTPAPGAGSAQAGPHLKKVGPYHILHRLGEGGMGIVYQAEQRHPVHRVVAVKLIKLGMDSQAVVARFEAERQALALMNHPSIARVFDVGTSEQGRPYFVMEFVPGQPITRYCDTRGLDMRGRLELFASVCDAIQHAHTKGVIHRDLKPANVLVTEIDGRPVPKVIDFGVAKALNQRLTERTLFTELGHMVGTPEYMSPEQAEMSAGDVDARSDVYSLGAMLYELLTGTLPFDAVSLRSRAWGEIQRILREVDPPRPSTRFTRLRPDDANALARARHESVHTLGSKLRRELEWIPLKAMRKEVAARYRTASEMGDDIRNYLAGRPLLAGPESSLYRARKFLRRNRFSVAAAAAMVLLLIAGIAGTSIQAYRAHQQRAAAEEQRTLATQRFEDVRELANRLIVELQPEVDRLAGSGPAVRKIADMSLEYLSDLEKQSGDDPKLLRDVAMGYVRLSDIQGGPNVNNTGDFESAAASLQAADRAVRRSLELGGENSEILAVAGSIQIKLGDIHARRGDRAAAEASFQAAGGFYDKAAGLAPDSPNAAYNRLLPAVRRSELQLQSGDIAGATAAREAMLEAMRGLVERFPGNEDMLEKLGAALDGLASVHLSTQENAKAVPLIQESISIHEAQLAANPDDASTQEAIAGGYSSLTRAYARLGDNVAAMESVEKALKPLRRIYEADTANQSSLHGLGASLILKGDLLSTAERYEEAQAVCEEVIALYRRGLETSPEDRVFRQMLVVSLGGLAVAHEKQNELAEALEARETGLTLLSPMVEADPGNQQLRAGLAFTQMQAAQTHNLMGQHLRALELTTAAIQVFEEMIASGTENPASIGWIVEAREHHVRALDGLVTDPATSTGERERLRTQARDVLATLRANYLRLNELGGSSEEAMATSLAKADELERNLVDDSRIGTPNPLP